MSARELMDETREFWIADASISPVREIVYTRSSDDTQLILNSTVGGGVFNEIEKKKIEDYQSFGSLKLTQTPVVATDIIDYDGETFKVMRYAKLGTLYTVYGKKSRHAGRPKR